MNIGSWFYMQRELIYLLSVGKIVQFGNIFRKICPCFFCKLASPRYTITEELPQPLCISRTYEVEGNRPVKSTAEVVGRIPTVTK